MKALIVIIHDFLTVFSWTAIRPHHGPSSGSNLVGLFTLLVTTVGVGFAIYVSAVQIKDIRTKQTELLQRSRDRARLRVGFTKSDTRLNGDSLLDKRYKANKTKGVAANNITAMIAVINHGKLSARELLVNVYLPGDIAIRLANSMEEKTTYSNDHDSNVAIFTMPFIHPSDFLSFECLLTIPSTHNDFNIEVRISMSDTPESVTYLKVVNQ